MKKKEETGKTLADGNRLQGDSGLFLVGLAACAAFSPSGKLGFSPFRKLGFSSFGKLGFSSFRKLGFSSFGKFLFLGSSGLRFRHFFVILYFTFSRNLILQLFYRP